MSWSWCYELPNKITEKRTQVLCKSGPTHWAISPLQEAVFNVLLLVWFLLLLLFCLFWNRWGPEWGQPHCGCPAVAVTVQRTEIWAIMPAWDKQPLKRKVEFTSFEVLIHGWLHWFCAYVKSLWWSGMCGRMRTSSAQAAEGLHPSSLPVGCPQFLHALMLGSTVPESTRWNWCN